MALAHPGRQRFCEEFLVDLNGTDAYLRLGYTKNRRSAQALASKLLDRPEVQAEIKRLQDDRSARVRLTADDVLRELRLLVLSDIEHYHVGDDGKLVLSPDAPRSASRAISRKKLTRRQVPGEWITSPDGEAKPAEKFEVEITLWDKTAAIRMAMDHLGLSKQLTLEVILELLPAEFSAAVREHLAAPVPEGSHDPTAVSQ